MFLPPRDASLVDLARQHRAARCVGGLLAAIAGARASACARRCPACARRAFLAGKLGDFGLALLALWLVAQINPGIPLFAVDFDAGARGAPALAAVARTPRRRLHRGRANRRSSSLGVGLFLALLLRERRYVGGAVLLLIGAALLLKGVAAMLLLKPAVWEAWLKPGVSIGIAAGALALLLGGVPAAPGRRSRRARSRCCVAAAAARRRPTCRRARAAHAVQLALRPPAQLQRPDALGAARLADRRRGVAVRARRQAGVGATGLTGASRPRAIYLAACLPERCAARICRARRRAFAT